MRKPRDFDTELKTLTTKVSKLKERRVHQLGELVAATGADALNPELLAGALLDAASTKDAATREDLASAWRCVLSGEVGRLAPPRSRGANRRSGARGRRRGGLRHKRRAPTCGNGQSNAANAPAT